VLNRSGSESRLLVSRGADALSVNPADHKIYELKGEDPVWVLPAEGLSPKTMKESAAWVVSSRGLVTLVNGNMEAAPPFPVMTGLKLSCAPAAWNGRIYLPVEEAGGRGGLYVIDSSARIVKLEKDFESPMLSPPSFGESFMALYPKSFLGEIYLCDTDGIPQAAWPRYAPGIAYGSPLVFRGDSGLGSGTLVAFITMAGELSVYTEQGSVLPGFPLELPGVFYLQPVWDGEYLWAAAEEGSLFRVDLNGRMTEQQAPDLTVREEGCITAADVDKDGIPEIFISGEGNAIYGYSRNLISIEGFPLSAWGRPAFADLDADDTMDCAAAGMDNKLYRWRFKQ
ncbi:MAG: VCBS repeat-containing protein, partial [Treponema sp.]|nr:VCBS repeat-containing protein [Treponema sp.]